MNKEFIRALNELEKEKNVKKEVVLDALEKALIKSYQKNYENNENVTVEINKETGDISVYSLREVVDDVEDDINQISTEEARKIDKKLKIGDICRVKLAPKNFGRVAAQTARNIVLQQIKDAQRDTIYSTYLDRENEIITGLVQRRDKYNIYVNLDRIEGIVPNREQVPGEEYPANQRMKFLIKSVKNTAKEPQIILSRASEELVIRLFELEVPEIVNGVIEIYAIAREAGSRTKLAVFSNDENVDCVGACIGFKGTRVNSIVEELQGEKIDIINYDKDIRTYISNALSPAEIIDCLVNEDKKQSLVVVDDDQLSLAIGKEGQNARLAAKLTGWKIDIKSKSKFESLSEEEKNELLGLVEAGNKKEVDSSIKEDLIAYEQAKVKEVMEEKNQEEDQAKEAQDFIGDEQLADEISDDPAEKSEEESKL